MFKLVDEQKAEVKNMFSHPEEPKVQGSYPMRDPL